MVIPLVAAHRGSSGGNIPCNSKAAFEAALFQGADIIELDVSKSIDGRLLVFHPFKENAHLNRLIPLGMLPACANLKRHFVNQDNVKTDEKILTLDSAFEILKDRCVINIDKFWTAPEKIAECIRKHSMQRQVIIKIPDKEKHILSAERYAPDIPLMVMVKEEDKVTDSLIKRKLKFIGVEAIFKSESSPAASDEYINRLHRLGLKIWGNAIVYDKREVISAGHNDDAAMTGDPDKGWGWFMDKGFDMVQTDWVLPMKRYFECRKREATGAEPASV